MNEKSQYIKAVIFDLDGVLVDTIELKADAHVETIRSFGGDVEHNFYSDVVGLSHNETRSAYIKASKLEIDPDAYTQIYRKILSGYLKNRLRLVHGILPLIKKISKSGLPIAVVTSSPGDFLKKCLQLTGIAQYFSVCVSSDDVVNKKPSPEPYVYGIKKLSTSPETVLVFEDSQAGLESAHMAGTHVMIFRHRYNIDHNFSGAEQVFCHPIDPESIFQFIEEFPADINISEG